MPIKNWPVLGISSGAALFVFAVFWSGFAFINRHKRGGFFLDPQDSYAEGQPGREFPLSAQQGTFEPLLKHYIGVAQLVFTVAAGSIALGGSFVSFSKLKGCAPPVLKAGYAS